ncbi:hypothetical protein O7599_01645 [Streptomyces sp. WMMC500]|uniref:hypothetical protein n=1 Tax=Streptomyces sp. WMMC500 TaxID=3015154 RepID=UPI00248ABE9E|nr:hypothetical protein [Streptomyces sp. WMMC500]WBB61294.1 hypothetical protein O7599_01645 [Streptomyces sp. WMMC500]
MDAQRITDAAARVGRFFGPPVTDEAVGAVEQQVEAVSQARPLIQAALDAAPRLSDVAAVLSKPTAAASPRRRREGHRLCRRGVGAGIGGVRL